MSLQVTVGRGSKVGIKIGAPSSTKPSTLSRNSIITSSIKKKRVEISQMPPPTLGALSFSATSFTAGTASSGAIVGATALSTITASGLPTGLTINGTARTWAWDGAGTAGSGSFTLTETLAGAVGSPKSTTISYAIAAGRAAPALKFNVAANSQYVALAA